MILHLIKRSGWIIGFTAIVVIYAGSRTDNRISKETPQQNTEFNTIRTEQVETGQPLYAYEEKQEFISLPLHHEINNDRTQPYSMIDNPFNLYNTDFIQLNDNQGRCNHESPDIAVDKDGNTIVVWLDDRDFNTRIWGQRFDKNGTPLGENFQIRPTDHIQNDYMIEHNFPRVGVDEEGNFIVAWMEKQDYFDFYCRRFDKDGNPLGDAVNIMDELDWSKIYSITWGSLDVAVNDSGASVVIWCIGFNDTTRISGQVIDRTGTPVGSNFHACVEDESQYPSQPSVGMDAQGNFVITWNKILKNPFKKRVVFQRFDRDANPVDSVRTVKTKTIQNLSWPSIAVHDSGNYIIAFSDAFQGVILQHYDKSGNTTGDVIDAYAGSYSDTNPYPALCMDNEKNCVVVWQAGDRQNPRIMTRQFDSSGAALNGSFQVNDNSFPYICTLPRVDCDSTGRFMVVWQDDRQGHQNIFSQNYTSGGLTIGPNTLVNDDAGSDDQLSPSVVFDASGNAMAVWKDTRNGMSDIFGQYFDSEITLSNGNKIINDDYIQGASDKSSQENPSIAAWNDGGYVVSWVDYRDSKRGVYCQLFNNQGEPAGSNIKVAEAQQWASYYSQTAASDNGNFIVVYSESQFSGQSIRGQLYTQNGSPVGNGFTVSEDTTGQQLYSAKVAMDSEGGFIVIWIQGDYSESPIYGKWFDSSGVPQDSVFRISDENPGTDFLESPEIILFEDKSFCVTWIKGTIYYRLFDTTGKPLGPSTDVIDPGFQFINRGKRTKQSEDGSFVIAWQYNSSVSKTPSVYYQLFDRSKQRTGMNIPFIEDIPVLYEFYGSMSMDMAWYSDNIYLISSLPLNRYQRYDVFAYSREVNFPPYSPQTLYPEHHSFITTQTPVLVFLVPEDKEIEEEHFKISIAADAAMTELVNESPFESQINTAGFEPKPPLQQPGDTCRYTIQSALVDGQYFWQVSAKDPQNYSLPSEMRCFYVDTKPPYTSDHHPLRNAVNVPARDSISVHVKDDMSGVDSSSIIMKVKGIVVNHIIRGDSSDYIVTFQKHPPWGPEERIVICIEASDLLGHIMPVDTLVFTTTHIVSVEKDAQNVPSDYILYPNFPNPFNPATTITYALPVPDRVHVEIFNMTGQKVRTLINDQKEAGTYSVQWEGRDAFGKPAGSGIYICRMQTGHKIFEQKMILIR
jgi:hypothetical protein